MTRCADVSPNGAEAGSRLRERAVAVGEVHQRIGLYSHVNDLVEHWNEAGTAAARCALTSQGYQIGRFFQLVDAVYLGVTPHHDHLLRLYIFQNASHFGKEHIQLFRSYRARRIHSDNNGTSAKARAAGSVYISNNKPTVGTPPIVRTATHFSCKQTDDLVFPIHLGFKNLAQQTLKTSG